MKSVCVFCGSRSGNDKEIEKSVLSLSQEFKNRALNLVYGGAGVGLMGLVADACLKEGLRVTGVLPENFHTVEIAHAGLTKLIRVSSMHERKFKMYELSDAFLVIPGGLGTLDELFEIVTWKQIGLHNKPIGIWNINNYFDELWNFLQKTEKKGFVSELSSLVHISPKLETILNKF